MSGAPDDLDVAPNPQSAHRVALRALALAALSCRALIESDAHEPDAEKLRQRVVAWADAIGVSAEMEPAEASLLAMPLGKLDRKTVIDGSWQSEGMAVLAWALRYAELPPFHVQCEPSDIANGMGFLNTRERTVLNSPRLRNWDEVEAWADRYLTIHWRLRQFSSHPGPMDLADYVARCNWGPLRLDGIEILASDLALGGVRIDRVENILLRHTLSIVQERHRGFNWLLGFEPLYSQVTTDT